MKQTAILLKYINKKVISSIIILLITAFFTDKDIASPSIFINYAAYMLQNDSIKMDSYLIKIIQVADGKYGYDIYSKQILFIHQPAIPALPGNNGFATKTDAEKVAKLVVEKIKKGGSLPTITVEELKHLGIVP